MAPPSASAGSSAWVRKKTPLRCTFTRSSKSFSVVAANGAVRSVPALLTRKSNVVLPQRASLGAELLGEVREGVHDAGIEPQRDGGTSQIRDSGHDFLGLSLVASIGHDDIDARLGEVQRVGAPETSIGSGDDGDLLGDAHDDSLVARRGSR